VNEICRKGVYFGLGWAKVCKAFTAKFLQRIIFLQGSVKGICCGCIGGW
jgi:hypothetical protein